MWLNPVQLLWGPPLSGPFRSTSKYRDDPAEAILEKHEELMEKADEIKGSEHKIASLILWKSGMRRKFD